MQQESHQRNVRREPQPVGITVSWPYCGAFPDKNRPGNPLHAEGSQLVHQGHAPAKLFNQSQHPIHFVLLTWEQNIKPPDLQSVRFTSEVFLSKKKLYNGQSGDLPLIC